MRPIDPTTLRRELDALATSAPSLRAYREGVLDVLARFVPFDGAFVHALSPRVPLETGVLRGLDSTVLSRSLAHWDDMAVELGALRERANQELVAASDEVYPLGTRRRARFQRQIVRRFGVSSLCIVHLVVRGSVRSAIVLFARRHGAFTTQVLSALRQLAPLIAAGDLLHALLDGVPRASSPIQLVCNDGRLTPRQRQIVDLVALGQTNQAIARALGVSPNTARNHLARIFERLGASNRADLLRLAVLSPAS